MRQSWCVARHSYLRSPICWCLSQLIKYSTLRPVLLLATSPSFNFGYYPPSWKGWRSDKPSIRSQLSCMTMRGFLPRDVEIWIRSGIGTPILKSPCSIRVLVPLLSQLQSSNGLLVRSASFPNYGNLSLLLSDSVHWRGDASKVGHGGTLYSILSQGVASKAFGCRLTFP